MSDFLDRSGTTIGHRLSAERRQLSVMFCDLVGSTALSARLDPEDLQDLLGAYRARIGEIVSAHGGFVAEYRGDGALIYFGYPEAHEDDSERSVRAGLALVKGVADLDVDGAHLKTRIGIATGLVVVGGRDDPDRGLAGETPNLAARLQQLAEPDTVVIGESTKKLLGDLFITAALPAVTLKGIAEPVAAWLVLDQNRGISRFEALRGARVTPLVGRGDDIELVLDRACKVVASNVGQVILIAGEPGIGKSRFVYSVKERLMEDRFRFISYACSPQHENSVLFPFVAQLQHAAGLDRIDEVDVGVGKLRSMLVDRLAMPEVVVPMFAELMGIPVGRQLDLADMSPPEKRALLARALLANLEELAALGPTLAILEDAHWLDPTSRDLLEQILKRVAKLPILLVITCRQPAGLKVSLGSSDLTSIVLNRLTRSQTKTLIELVAADNTLSADIQDSILERTEGVPLFAEELTKAVLESAENRIDQNHRVYSGAALPATLHDSLMARLDRLSSGKAIAQVAACIGREFDYELLLAVAPFPEAAVASSIDQLVRAELLVRQDGTAGPAYTFKHVLIRDAAYQSLLRRRRRELHERIATTLESTFSGSVGARPEFVAYHFHEAGLFEKAADCWLQSARLAAAQSANMEAIAHARSGLAAVEAIPLGEARTRLELSLLLALGGPILAAKGWASRESDAVYQRAQMLSRELKDDKNLFKALQGQGFVHKVRGNIREAAQLMEKTVQLAGAGGDPTMRIEAYHLAGAVSYHQGKFETALNWFRQSIGVDEHGGGHHSSIYGIKMGVFDRAYISHCEWQIGHVDAALRTAEEALTLAQGIEQPLSEIVALSYLAMLRQFRQEPVHAIEIAEQALRIGAEYRFDYYVALSALIRAWALVEQGAVDEGLEAYDFALGQFKGTGALLRLPHYLCLLAAAQGRSNPEAGLRTLEEAGEIAKGSQERWCDSELERTRGELRLIQDSGATAEAHKSFQRAVKLATRQGARMYELRARMSDARLWHSLGQRKKALEGLGAINDRLSEGQGTTDVRNAEALLKELRESVHEYRR